MCLQILIYNLHIDPIVRFYFEVYNYSLKAILSFSLYIKYIEGRPIYYMAYMYIYILYVMSGLCYSSQVSQDPAHVRIALAKRQVCSRVVHDEGETHLFTGR